MARPLSEAEKEAAIKVIIDLKLTTAKLQTIQDSIFTATGRKISINSGSITRLRDEAAARIQTATQSAAAQMMTREIKTLDTAVETTQLIENLAEMSKELWDRLSNDAYSGPIPAFGDDPKAYLALLREYNNVVTNLARFRPPPPPVMEESQLDPRYQSRYIADLDAEIKGHTQALMQVFLSKGRVEAGGEKREAAKTEQSEDSSENTIREDAKAA